MTRAAGGEPIVVVLRERDFEHFLAKRLCMKQCPANAPQILIINYRSCYDFTRIHLTSHSPNPRR